MTERTSKIWFFPIVIAVVISFSCIFLDLPSDPGAVLFQDDFSSTNSGWDRYMDEVYSTDYGDGVYQITVITPDHEAWAVPGLEFSDVRISVIAEKKEGPDDNVFGVLCRYKDPQNFYFFMISSDGFAGVGLYVNGVRRILTGDSMFPSSAINQGNEPNTLRADCVGSRLTFIVNGKQIYDLEDESLIAGDVGLIAGTYDEGGIKIEYDDFLVKNP
ncbi:MAG: hypothetical protein GTO18_08495 [Anaerolineales bacterium]|nr:hypothetical protein [Anaerolineales bacterium]